MNDKKLTDMEIKEDLEYLQDNTNCQWCVLKGPCPLGKCIFTEALDLINRLQAENERLKEEVKEHIKKGVAKRKYDKALIKAEAYKEFAERLKENSIATFSFKGVVMVEEIDELLKELVGE